MCLCVYRYECFPAKNGRIAHFLFNSTRVFMVTGAAYAETRLGWAECGLDEMCEDIW